MEAETSVAIDPRPNSQLAYAATIQSTVGVAGAGSAYPTRSCIVQKRIRVYMSSDLGVNWKEMDGNDDLLATGSDPGSSFWATDPDVSVGGDGTLYLSFVKTSNIPVCDQTVRVANDPQASVQLWFAPPGGRLQPALPTPTGLRGPNPAVTAGPSGREGPLDHPKVAASPTPGVVVVYHVDRVDGFVTVTRQGSTYSIANRMNLQGPNGPLGNKFFAIAFDPDGDLYIVGNTLQVPGVRSVARFTLRSNPTRWDPVMAGPVPLTNGIAGAIRIPSLGPTGGSINFDGDVTPAVAISKLGATSDSIIYVASVTVDNMEVKHFEIAAANTTNLSMWVGPVEIDRPQGSLESFFPHMSVAGGSNLLDLVIYDMGLRPGAPAPPQVPFPNIPLADLTLNTVLYRFDAARLFTPGTVSANWLLSGPTVVNEVPLPFSLLPSRNAAEPSALFPGEYLGLASKGRNPIFSWPNLRPVELPTASAIDLGLASQVDGCATGMTSADPDNIWDCDCTCSGRATRVRGCGRGGLTDATQVCGRICTFISCTITHYMCAPSQCTSNGTGRIVSSHSCAVGDFPPLGGAPSTRADYAASDSGTSQATLTAGGTQSTTHLSGSLFLNASTSPPTPGAELEIALLDLQPADVFVGGSVNAFVRNIKVAERMKIRGIFTDATHFRIDPGFIDLMISLQTQPSEEENLSDPINVRASNSTAATGELNLATGSVSLDGTAADGFGNSADIHFRGSIGTRPPDSDGDGIIDPIDTCPGATVGPDRTAPVFSFVPPSIVTSSCSGLNIGRATASDACGVTVTSDAPSRFPIGTTIVRWTARDGAGNTTVATQSVTIVLGDDPSCCPAGTHVIVGTSNNDKLTGTPGSDCIIGKGAQDTINGGGGNDFISGGEGDDVLNGQDGNDTIFGGSGQDRLSGGKGNDSLSGDGGTDIVNGDDGDDTLYGGEGQDTLNGGAGTDAIFGGVGDDVISGGLGNDSVAGGSGNDHVNGDVGDDNLFGDDGDDHIDGGTGRNAFSGGGGHDICMDNGMTLAECPEKETL
jgi:Ca2+-binding RTX toxin-like protein